MDYKEELVRLECKEREMFRQREWLNEEIKKIRALKREIIELMESDGRQD